MDILPSRPDTSFAAPAGPSRRHALVTGAAALSALALSSPASAKAQGADSTPTHFGPMPLTISFRRWPPLR